MQIDIECRYCCFSRKNVIYRNREFFLTQSMLIFYSFHLSHNTKQSFRFKALIVTTEKLRRPICISTVGAKRLVSMVNYVVSFHNWVILSTCLSTHILTCCCIVMSFDVTSCWTVSHMRWFASHKTWSNKIKSIMRRSSTETLTFEPSLRWGFQIPRIFLIEQTQRFISKLQLIDSIMFNTLVLKQTTDCLEALFNTALRYLHN